MQKCRTVEMSTIDTHPFSSGAKEKQTNKQTNDKQGVLKTYSNPYPQWNS